MVAELQALLFDVDGTLADTERDGHRVAFNQAFEEAGLHWQWDEALYGKLLAVTGGKERMRFYIDSFLPEPPGIPDLDDFIAGLHQAKTRHYLALLDAGRIPLRPGVQRLLQEARGAGLRLAVATTTTPENVQSLLSNTLGAEAIDWFEVIAAGDIVPSKKPAPDIYVWAMEKMGLSPESCLAFEDSDNGVRSVLNAGIRSLVVTVNGYTAAQNMQGATSVLDGLGEPGSSPAVLAGQPLTEEYVDVAQLRAWHAAAQAA